MLCTPQVLHVSHFLTQQQLVHAHQQMVVGGGISVSPAMQRPAMMGGIAVSGRGGRAGEMHPQHQHPNAAFQQGQGQPSHMYQQQQGTCMPRMQQGCGGGRGGRGGRGVVPGNYPPGYPQHQPQGGNYYVEDNPNYGTGVAAAGGMGVGQQASANSEQEARHHVPSGPQENALIRGINTEIHNAAAGVAKQVEHNPELDSLSPQAPFDPNLICPMCRWQFRIGEIQKYRKHVKSCKTT